MARLVICQTCNEPFDRPKGSNRLNCERCRPSRAVPDTPATVTQIRPNGPPTLVQPPDTRVSVDDYVPQPHQPDAPHSPGRVEKHTIAELDRLGALETLEGALALGFAQALDDQWLPGAQRTSMTKQLQITIDGIRATIPAEKDGVDAYADVARRLREQAG